MYKVYKNSLFIFSNIFVDSKLINKIIKEIFIMRNCSTIIFLCLFIIANIAFGSDNDLLAYKKLENALKRREALEVILLLYHL